MIRNKLFSMVLREKSTSDELKSLPEGNRLDAKKNFLMARKVRHRNRLPMEASGSPSEEKPCNR